MKNIFMFLLLPLYIARDSEAIPAKSEWEFRLCKLMHFWTANVFFYTVNNRIDIYVFVEWHKDLRSCIIIVIIIIIIIIIIIMFVD